MNNPTILSFLTNIVMIIHILWFLGRLKWFSTPDPLGFFQAGWMWHWGISMIGAQCPAPNVWHRHDSPCFFCVPCIQKVTTPTVQRFLWLRSELFFMPGTRSESARTPQRPELGRIIWVLIFGSEQRSEKSCWTNKPPHELLHEILYMAHPHFLVADIYQYGGFPK